MLTKEELLKPRVILDYPYPGCTYKVGTILTLNNHVQEISVGKSYESEAIGNFLMWEKDIDSCIESGSNNFRRLKWWENRELSDLPEYVKDCNDNVHKVHKYTLNDHFPEAHVFISSKVIIISSHLSNFQPADESDYLAYENQTKWKQHQNASVGLH